MFKLRLMVAQAFDAHVRLGRILAFTVAAFGCSSAHPAQPVSIPQSAPSADSAAQRWAPSTFSPQPAQVLTGIEADLLRLCESGDAGLNRVASALAEHQAAGEGMLDTEHVTHELRAAGVPQVWPRAWAIVGKPSLNEARDGLSQFLSSFSEGGERRCGVGTATVVQGQEVISVIAVDALADLEPLPIRAHLGQWIQLRARLLERAVEAEVVVLGPRGSPRTVPTTLRDLEIRATFSVDQAGPWKVQVLPTFPSGPRPVLEAMVFVGEEPPSEFQATPVPGELMPSENKPPLLALFEMVNRARIAEGLLPLERLEALDVAASIHAKAMMEARVLAHDVGVGSPTMRLEALGIRPLLAGENVAHALSVVRSHRALWDSPSHRSNLLHEDFTHVGIGLAEDLDGSVWVCEMFAQFAKR